jgi:hypothetical protein
MRLKEILLKSVPYLLSFSGGIAMFLISIHITRDENWIGLLSNVSASLLAIPLIFFFYDYSNYRVSSSVNKTLADSLTFEINSSMLRLLVVFRKIMGARDKFGWESIQKMLNKKSDYIKSDLKTTRQYLEKLKACTADLDELAYKAVKTSVLDPQQIQTLEYLVKSLSHLINESRFSGGHKIPPKQIENVLSLVDDWFDSCEREAQRANRHFQLAMDAADI